MMQDPNLLGECLNSGCTNTVYQQSHCDACSREEGTEIKVHIFKKDKVWFERQLQGKRDIEAWRETCTEPPFALTVDHETDKISCITFIVYNSDEVLELKEWLAYNTDLFFYSKTVFHYTKDTLELAGVDYHLHIHEGVK